MHRIFRFFTPCFVAVCAIAAPQILGAGAEKDSLRADYYRLIDADPAAARAARDRYMAIVNQEPREDPFFSFVLGSQWPGALDEEKFPGRKGTRSQLQGCEVVLNIGSDILKIVPKGKYLRMQGIPYEGTDWLHEIIHHPFYQNILDLPYRVMLFWAHGAEDDKRHGRQMTEEERDDLYREFFLFTKHLLTRYQGSGKTFLIGNWEGDWMAAGGYKIGQNDLSQERIDAYTDWLEVRTRAIDDAKAATPHSGVAVYSYLEINHTRVARDKGLKRLVNTVLPRSRVDFVSISSYDFQSSYNWPKPRTAASLRRPVFTYLDYVESQLPPRDVPGKRVFIGEIGYTWEEIAKQDKISIEQAKSEQTRMALSQARVNLEWGVPLWLWWATFSSHEGTYGLVDNNTNEPSPLHDALKEYYDWARAFTREHEARHGKTPSFKAFQAAALQQLDRQISRF
jgi:hypothetical protein